MGNYLKEATPSPTSIPSKGKTSITVACEVDDPGHMTITPQAGFDIAPISRDLVKGQTRDTFDLTITRTTSATLTCNLFFHFDFSITMTSVQVT